MSKKINISIVGTGLMGLQHIKAIQKSKKANLHSIVDISNNCLLYTSPSPRDQRGSRMPSSA